MVDLNLPSGYLFSTFQPVLCCLFPFLPLPPFLKLITLSVPFYPLCWLTHHMASVYPQWFLLSRQYASLTYLFTFKVYYSLLSIMILYFHFLLFYVILIIELTSMSVANPKTLHYFSFM